MLDQAIFFRKILIIDIIKVKTVTISVGIIISRLKSRFKCYFGKANFIALGLNLTVRKGEISRLFQLFLVSS